MTMTRSDGRRAFRPALLKGLRRAAPEPLRSGRVLYGPTLRRTGSALIIQPVLYRIPHTGSRSAA